MTLHTATDDPRRLSAARRTHVGLMHTEANLYCSAFVAQLVDLGRGGVGFQQRVVYV
jgi:hypothetical protein